MTTQKSDLDRKRDHAAYMRASRKFKEKQREELYKIFGALGDKVLDILDSMVQASVSNPLLGIASASIIADILYRARVIDLTTFAMIMVSTGVLEGAAVAGSVIQDVADFTKVFTSQAQSSDPIRPSASTVVFGNKTGDLQALLGEKGLTQ